MKAPSCCLVSHTLQSAVGPADANRLLAVELAKQGCQVSLCGLNDPTASAIKEDELDLSGTLFPALYLPEKIEWSQRCEVFRAFLKQHQTEHVIFRFIPYSLNPKGIVWKAANFLPNALRGYSVIWLMDEIWIEGSPKLKHRIVGALQRYCILRLLKGVRPRRIYTNNRFNTLALRQRDVNAETLRLFGNIPVAPSDEGAWLFREFEAAGIPISPANREQWLLLGNFGLFHPDWDSDAFLTKLSQLVKKHERQVCFVGIGSLGPYPDHWPAIASKWAAEFRFLHLGRRSEVEVSHLLQSVDFGITTNQYHLVGKSGTCMAMLDHGLPILVSRISERDDLSEFSADQLLRCDDHISDEIFTPRPHPSPDPQLPRAVATLLDAMS